MATYVQQRAHRITLYNTDGQEVCIYIVRCDSGLEAQFPMGLAYPISGITVEPIEAGGS